MPPITPQEAAQPPAHIAPADNEAAPEQVHFLNDLPEAVADLRITDPRPEPRVARRSAIPSRPTNIIHQLHLREITGRRLQLTTKRFENETPSCYQRIKIAQLIDFYTTLRNALPNETPYRNLREEFSEILQEIENESEEMERNVDSRGYLTSFQLIDQTRETYYQAQEALCLNGTLYTHFKCVALREVPLASFGQEAPSIQTLLNFISRQEKLNNLSIRECSLQSTQVSEIAEALPYSRSIEWIEIDGDESRLYERERANARTSEEAEAQTERLIQNVLDGTPYTPPRSTEFAPIIKSLAKNPLSELKHLDLSNGTLNLPHEISKNKRMQVIVYTPALRTFLLKHPQLQILRLDDLGLQLCEISTILNTVKDHPSLIHIRLQGVMPDEEPRFAYEQIRMLQRHAEEVNEYRSAHNLNKINIDLSRNPRG